MPSTRRQALRFGLVSVVVAPACGPGAAPSPKDEGTASANPAFGMADPTDNASFYVQSYSGTPAVDALAWRLGVTGLVSADASLSIEALRALPQQEVERTLQCIGATNRNQQIGNALWGGVRLDALLAARGVVIDPAAAFLHILCADGYREQLAVADVLAGEVFVAIEMNGAPLPADHGAPARLLVEGRYGMKCPKWIEQLVFATESIVGTWEGQGWSAEAFNRPAAFVHLPTHGQALYDAPFTLVGSAFCGATLIERVEVSGDDGATWGDGEIVRASSPDVWTTWRKDVPALGLGEHTFLVRVTAADGRTTKDAEEPGLEGFTLHGHVKVEVVAG